MQRNFMMIKSDVQGSLYTEVDYVLYKQFHIVLCFVRVY